MWSHSPSLHPAIHRLDNSYDINDSWLSMIISPHTGFNCSKFSLLVTSVSWLFLINLFWCTGQSVWTFRWLVSAVCLYKLGFGCATFSFLHWLFFHHFNYYLYQGIFLSRGPDLGHSSHHGMGQRRGGGYGLPVGDKHWWLQLVTASLHAAEASGPASGGHRSCTLAQGSEAGEGSWRCEELQGQVAGDWHPGVSSSCTLIWGGSGAGSCAHLLPQLQKFTSIWVKQALHLVDSNLHLYEAIISRCGSKEGLEIGCAGEAERRRFLVRVGSGWQQGNVDLVWRNVVNTAVCYSSQHMKILELFCSTKNWDCTVS